MAGCLPVRHRRAERVPARRCREQGQALEQALEQVLVEGRLAAPGLDTSIGGSTAVGRDINELVSAGLVALGLGMVVRGAFRVIPPALLVRVPVSLKSRLDEIAKQKRRLVCMEDRIVRPATSP